MLDEIKYIIVKDKAGRLHHFKSNWLHHYTIARDNGYNEDQVIESGLFLDKHLYILECEGRAHLVKHSREYIGNCLNFYQDIKLKSWLAGRELESSLYYSKKPIYQEAEYKTLRPGD